MNLRAHVEPKARVGHVVLPSAAAQADDEPDQEDSAPVQLEEVVEAALTELGSRNVHGFVRLVRTAIGISSKAMAMAYRKLLK